MTSYPSITLWTACLLYLWPLKHRSRYLLRVAAATGVSVVLFVAKAEVFPKNDLIQTALTYLLCAAFVHFCGDLEYKATLYCSAWVMITQQLAEEISCVLAGDGFFSRLPFYAIAFVVYLVIYAAAGITIVRYMPEQGSYQIGPRQLTSMLLLLLIFELLFAAILAMLALPQMNDIYVTNLVLVQICLAIILYLQNTLFKKSAMQQELATLNRFWHQQKEQYELSRETIALINHKCHDLKHQIAAMRAITSPEEREKYLREVEDSVQIYDAIVKTGNEVLDTVLTEKSLFCAANHIKINCIADGRRMDLMDPVDLYTVFGNALDNAIESVKKLERQEMRMIDVIIYVRKQFLMINIMNPMGETFLFEDGLPLSTKAKNGYHGFGLKSIRHTIEKYNGFMKIDTAENIFSLKILIPLRSAT